MFATNIYKKFALPLAAPLGRSLIISTVLQAIAAVFAITGNLLVLTVYYENAKLRTRVSSLFAINLAISDFIIGFLVLPLMIFTNVCILFDEVLFLRAVIESILIPFLSSVSIWTLLGASVDRLIAIRFPESYITRVTRKRIHIAVSFSWLYSSTWIWFPFLPGIVGKYFLMIRSLIGFLVIMLILFGWATIYRVMRQRRRKTSECAEGHPNAHMWYCMERKVAKIFFFVTITLYACFTPLWIRAVGHFFGVLDEVRFLGEF